MRILTPLLLGIVSILSPSIADGELVHDESAVISREFEDHAATLSFANLYDRDSRDRDKPGGIRVFLKMNKVGPMILKLEQATVSRDGGPWQICKFGDQAYNSGSNEPYDYKNFDKDETKYPNYFNVLVLCPAETIPADRSNGYAGIDPLKLGIYSVRVFYTLNGKQYKCEVDLKLSRVQWTSGETEPAYLVVSPVGNRIVEYHKGEELYFTVMAEIEGCLNFSLRGDFTDAKITSATVLAPDGKNYQLAPSGEQPPTGRGTLFKFLSIKHGDAFTKFTIGRWKVRIEFSVDGNAYRHEADYFVTLRPPGYHDYPVEKHYVNVTPEDAEQAGAGQPATRPESKTEGGDKHQPEAEGRSR